MNAGRTIQYIVGAALVLGVLWPVVGGDDDFPLSTYPMFSGKQPREATITHAIGIDTDGSRAVLPPRVVANDEVIQAFETLRKAARSTAASADLCGYVAQRAPRDVIAVEIISDRFDAIAYFEGDRVPRSSTVHARCETAR
jgi:hypothetical protein